MSKSKIEWTEHTWNFLIGCDKVSAGCKNCYAIPNSWIRQHNPKMAEKFEGVVKKNANGTLNWTGRVNLHEPSLVIPIKMKQPTIFFVNSMSDLFHESVSNEILDRAFTIMEIEDRHTYQILTKRPKRMYEYCKTRYMDKNRPMPKSIWLLVSVEDQASANERVHWLTQIPSAVRGISAEPLLGHVDLQRVQANPADDEKGEKHFFDAFRDYPMYEEENEDGSNDITDGPGIYPINWVIVGGESGRDARPMHPMWAKYLRDQCQENEVSFFFKQWGEHQWGSSAKGKNIIVLTNGDNDNYGKINPNDLADRNRNWHALDPTVMSKVGKKESGNFLGGRIYLEMPLVKHDR